jgi:hypothetical protein
MRTSRSPAGKRSRGHIALALFAAAVYALPSAAAASQFRRLAVSTVTFASDGARYVAWQTVTDGPIIVFDSGTGRRRSVTAPAGCQLADEEDRGSYGRPAAAGRFSLNCPAGATELLLATTGTVTPLPAPGVSDAGWYTVGLRYVEGRAGRTACRQSASELKSGAYCIALYDLATKVVSYRPGFQPPDINEAHASAICVRLRKRLLAEEKGLPRGFTYGAGFLARSAPNRGGVALEGCGGRRRILPASGEAENFDLRGGLLTWDTGLPGAQFQDSKEVPYGKLWGYELSTGRRRSWTLPRLALVGERPVSGVLGYSTHTTNTVLWIATRTVILNTAISVGTSSVYAASVH